MAEILSDEDKKAIVKALEDAQILRAEIARAKRAGLDVSTLEQELQDLVLKLNNLRQVYVTQKRSS